MSLVTPEEIARAVLRDHGNRHAAIRYCERHWRNPDYARAAEILRGEMAAATRESPEGRALLAGAPVVIKCGGCGGVGTDADFASPKGHQFTRCPHCGLTIQIDRVCGQTVVTVVQAGRVQP